MISGGDAVRDAALAQAIDREIARIDARFPPPDMPRAHLRAVGLGYLDFAAAEPGLFRAAFKVTATPTDREASRSPKGLDPFGHLGAALDRMVGAGLLPSDRRPGAEFLAWSSVHGFAKLINEGSLGRLPENERRAIGERAPRAGRARIVKAYRAPARCLLTFTIMCPEGPVE